MDAPIVTCAKCGQRNRLSAASSKKGIWKCRKCGNELSAEAATASPKRGRTLMIAIGAAAAAALLIAVYASFWRIEVSRTRAFAAAAAYEFNEGSFDRAAALALSGLPKAGSLFGLFQPGDAEAELRRTGIHQIKDERLIPKGKDANYTALKERFLARVADGAQVILTDVASGQQRPRSIAAVCAKARSSESCAVNEIDTDDEGQRLLLTLDDGSIWLVNADDSAKMVVASKCAKAGAAGRSDPGSCMPSRIHLSAAGRYAVVNTKPQAFIAFDLDTGAERTLDLSRDCDAEKTQLSKSLCQEYQVRVLLFRGDDVLLARHGSRATLWMLSENGIVRDLPTPVDRAVKGPDKTLTGYSISGDTVAQIIPTAGQTPAQGTTIKLGNCDALIPPSQPPAKISGCRISSIAVSPKNSDLAVAITGGDIIVRQPTGDDAPSDPHILRVDCLPIKADAFALLDMDRPTRCSITDLRFAPDGTALAALGNDRMLRVFRVGGEEGREGSLLASVALDAAVSFFGFDANSETLTVALGTGAIRRFDLVAPPPRGLGALRSEICARLADHASPLTEFSAADIDEVGARFPDLKLSAADRSPCTP